jgi:hypothetical protein
MTRTAPMSYFKRSLAAAIPVAVLAVASSPAAARARKAPAKAPEPVLAIKKIQVKELPGTPPYILVDEATRASGFVVDVSVKNEGKAESGKSVVELKLEQKGRVIWRDDAFIPAQKPGAKPETVAIPVSGLKAQLGFLKPIVTVKWAVSKTVERAESKSVDPPIPVVAREWKVNGFSTYVNFGGQGPSDDTFTGSGFVFHFSRFDESQQEFVYTADGQIQEKAFFDGGGCSGQGSTSQTQPSWPQSDLRIKANLTQYSASIQTRSQPPVTFTITCPALNNYSYQSSEGWNDLATFTGARAPASMSPDATTLSDEASTTTPVGPVKFSWDFTARVSGV